MKSQLGMSHADLVSNSLTLKHREFSIYGSWDGQKGIYLLYICEAVGGVTFTVIHSSGASNHNPVCTELINVILKLCSKEQFKNLNLIFGFSK